MKTIALILTMAITTSALADTEAERQARYDANMAAAQSQVRINPSPFTGIPVAPILSGGALAYSIAKNPTNNPYALATYGGAAASMLPYITNRTLSSVLNGR